MRVKLLRRLRRKAQRNVKIRYDKDYATHLVIRIVNGRFMFIVIDENLFLTSEEAAETDLRALRIKYIRRCADNMRIRKLSKKLKKL